MSETTVWYEIVQDFPTSSFRVKEIQVVKQTAKSLVVREAAGFTNDGRTRDVRRMMGGNYFDSKESANAAVLERLNARVQGATDRLRVAAFALSTWRTLHGV